MLRLLLDREGKTTDGLHWVVNMKEEEKGYPLNEDVLLDFDFERPLPQFPTWPKRQVLQPE